MPRLSIASSPEKTNPADEISAIEANLDQLAYQRHSFMVEEIAIVQGD